MNNQKFVPEKTFPCKECGKVYTDESGMLLHFLQFHRHDIDVEVAFEPFACSVCDLNFISHTEFQKHFKGHKVETLYCKQCNFKCNFEYDLKSHMKVHNKEKTTEVIVESVEVEDDLNNIEFQKHSKGHKVVTLYCKQCNFKCNFESDLKSHMKVHNKEKTEVIVECVEVENDLNNNECHPFTCTDCGNSFNCYIHLKWHLITHGKKKYYSCSECEYKTNRQFNFKVHTKKHNDTKQFECSECDYKAKNEICLLKHINIHEQKKDRKLSLRKFRTPDGKSDSSTTASYLNLSYFSVYCTSVTKSKVPKLNHNKNVIENSKNQLQSNHNAIKEMINSKAPKGKKRKTNGQFARHEKAKNLKIIVNHEFVYQETEIEINSRKYGKLKRKSALPFRCSYCSADCASLKQIDMHKEIHNMSSNNYTPKIEVSPIIGRGIQNNRKNTLSPAY